MVGEKKNEQQNSLSSCLSILKYFLIAHAESQEGNSKLKKFHRFLWQRTFQPGNWQLLFFYLYENTAIANLFLDSQFNFDSL